MKIVYINEGYPEVRCIINKVGRKWQYKRIARFHDFAMKVKQSVYKLVCRAVRRKYTYNWDIRAIYRSVFQPKRQLIHTFNTVCDAKGPWISTFETIIPRTNTTCTPGLPDVTKVTRRGFELLRSDQCKALIAISHANKNIQLRAMEYLDIPGRDEIEKKICVCPPPQPVLISSKEFDEKMDRLSQRIDFIFVGRLFFRKGGAQVVDAFVELAKKYPNIHLTVVSSFQYGDNVSRSTACEREEYERLCKTVGCITHFEALPNEEVLELCKKAHCGLLPTFADTYGYSVLEMQACGCPVITTDIRALPEMNNEKCGWLIRVPKHPSTEAVYETNEDLENLKKTVRQGIDSILHEIMEEPEKIRYKGKCCIDRIRACHSPQKYECFLSELYENAAQTS